MRKVPNFWGLHAEPPQWLNINLALLPFLIVILLYGYQSAVKLAENPDYKLLPSVSKMVDSMEGYVTGTENRRTGEIEYTLRDDTVVSLRRLFYSLLIATSISLAIGLNMGLFPGMRSFLSSFVTAWAKVQAIALLPIVFITFGTGEFGKIMLIIIGITAPMILDIDLAVRELPKEQITKALTLGASTHGVVYRVILPQIKPRLLNILRLQLGPAWTFLLAGEFITSDAGLGYRIFLVRRYLSMDVIIPYVLWITLLGFLLDAGIQAFSKWRYPWYQKA